MSRSCGVWEWLPGSSVCSRLIESLDSEGQVHRLHRVRYQRVLSTFSFAFFSASLPGPESAVV